MKRTALAIALALLVASPVMAKAGASVTAGGGPYVFGGHYATFDIVAAWAPTNHVGQFDAYWARVACQADDPAQGGWAQYQSLTSTVQQGGWTAGPTPSWWSGGAHCRLDLVKFSYHRANETVATDTFVVGP